MKASGAVFIKHTGGYLQLPPLSDNKKIQKYYAVGKRGSKEFGGARECQDRQSPLCRGDCSGEISDGCGRSPPEISTPRSSGPPPPPETSTWGRVRVPSCAPRERASSSSGHREGW